MRLVVVVWLAAGCLSRPSPSQTQIDARMPGMPDAADAGTGVRLVQFEPVTMGELDAASSTLPGSVRAGDSLVAVVAFTDTDQIIYSATWSDSLGRTWNGGPTSYCDETGLAIGYAEAGASGATDTVMVQLSDTATVIALGVYEFSGIGDQTGVVFNCWMSMDSLVTTGALPTDTTTMPFVAFADTNSVQDYTVAAPFVVPDAMANTLSYAVAYYGEQGSVAPPGTYVATASQASQQQSWISLITAFDVP